jgi:alkyl sulfatase BDS1-like metallo-beta-lactamase superfamily hydrolase
VAELDYADQADFEDAEKGYLGSIDPPVVRAKDGAVVWDAAKFDFIEGDCPDTASPSLWRQGKLAAKHGLFEVTDGIYQARGLDLSNISFVESSTGVIVIDPLMSVETAAAALGLYRQHRGDRPVTAVIHTHSHADHYAGVAAVAGPGTPIYAPAGFMAHAVSENVYAGAAMSRRAAYMYASDLPAGPAGQIGAGLGMATSMGTMSLMKPTVDVTRTGQEEVIDGVRVVFQVTPGTEAPAEMNFFFPGRRALCMAENATHTLHNLLTLRGAEVRDARAWSRYLAEAIQLYGDKAEVVFASHHWPTWGRDRIVGFLSQQRDLYGYLHDQTLRLANKGFTGIEIAELMQLPPALDDAWHARGYYGSVSHNVKAIYQRYLGWFDGNPAHLWAYPPEQEAVRYVEYMGGSEAVLSRARQSLADGDLRWVATVTSHVVFAEPGNAAAKDLLATALERLGYGAENGTWRNFYLRGASELRGPIAPPPPDTASPQVLSALTVEQLFDSIGVRVDGPKACSDHLTIDWTFTDEDRTYRTELSNGALIHADRAHTAPPADLSISLTKPGLLGVLASGSLHGLDHSGDPAALTRLLGHLDSGDHQFPIVTP